MRKYSMYTFTVAMLAGMILTGCSSSEEIPGGIPDNGPKLMIETRSADAAETTCVTTSSRIRQTRWA